MAEKYRGVVVDTPKVVAMLLIIKLFGVLFATLVFSKFSPLIDADLYLKGYFVIDPHLRTQLVQIVATGVNGIFWGGVTHWVFGVFSIVGLLYYYLTGGRRYVLVLTLLLPSSFVWTSIVSKEALFFGFFSLILVLWARYVTDKFSKRDFAFLLISFLICTLLRPHYAVVVIWLFCSVMVIKKTGWSAWGALAIVLIASATAIHLTVWNDLLLHGFDAIDPSARSSRFGLFGINPGSAEGFERFEQLWPLGIVVGIVGPLPSELFLRLEFVPFFVEGVLILLSPVLICFYAMKQRFKRKNLFFQIFFLCLVPAIFALVILHAPFGLLNPGSASRWRVNFETIFYLAPLLLFFNFKDSLEHEDCSLSS